MKAVVKETGEKVEVQDYGAKMCPRYWTKTQGYEANELSFPKDEDTNES